MKMNPPKMFPPVKRQLQESLQFLFENKSASSKVINYSFKKNKKWGARDRRVFAESFYEIVRNAGGYFSSLNKDDFCTLSEKEVCDIVDSYLEGAANEKSLEKTQGHLYWSVSKDLMEVLNQEFSQDKVNEFLENSNKEADVFLRVNRLKCDEDRLMNLLEEEDILTKKVKANCLKLVERKNIFKAKAFTKGFFEIQDGASQDVAPFMELEKGMRVADSCAGAGGKALHMSMLLENSGKIIAMDVFPKRLEELKKRAKRAGVQNIEVKEWSGTKTVKRMEERFDRVLLDVPCTGTGTYRRKPESKLFFTKDEHQRLLKTQEEILQLHSRLVKTGGLLIYATCSVLKSENETRVESFLSENKNFQLVEQKTNFVGQDGFDGFFMAKIKKEK